MSKVVEPTRQQQILALGQLAVPRPEPVQIPPATPKVLAPVQEIPEVVIP
jgi:hypothetical protein